MTIVLVLYAVKKSTGGAFITGESEFLDQPSLTDDVSFTIKKYYCYLQKTKILFSYST